MHRQQDRYTIENIHGTRRGGNGMEKKRLKVYKIDTALWNKEEGDVENYSRYRITARDAEDAMRIAKSKYIDVGVGEYIESVGVECYLDE